MNHQGLGVADVGDVAGQFHRLDEPLAGRAPARSFRGADPEPEDSARPERQIFVRPFVVRMRRQPRPVHVIDARVGFQPFGYRARVVDVRLDSVRQGLDALRQQEGGVRCQGRADVAKLFGAQAGEKGVFTEVAVPVESAVMRNRFVEERETLGGPGEPAGLDDHATEGGAVPAEKLGGRVHDNIRTPLDRSVQVRRRDGRVDDQRQIVRVGDLREPLQIGNLPGRVRDDFRENQFGLVGDGCCIICRVGTAHEGGVDAETPQRYIQLGDRTAIQIGGCDDVVARAGQRREGDELCGEAAGCGDGAEPALEARDSLLEGCDSRVCHPAVDIAVLLEGEAGRGIRRVIEDESGRLVDGERAGPGSRIRNIARVDCPSAKAPVSVGAGPVGVRSHFVTIPERPPALDSCYARLHSGCPGCRD